jgi:hypothetical protein
MAFLDTTRLVGLLFGVRCTSDTEYTSMDFQSRLHICLRCDVCSISHFNGQVCAVTILLLLVELQPLRYQRLRVSNNCGIMLRAMHNSVYILT